MTPGLVVRCRNRDWVLLPSESDEVHLLRPLAGAMDDVVAVNRRLADLIGGLLPEERVRAAPLISDAIPSVTSRAHPSCIMKATILSGRSYWPDSRLAIGPCH
jgi:hypothetical protein